VGAELRVLVGGEAHDHSGVQIARSDGVDADAAVGELLGERPHLGFGPERLLLLLGKRRRGLGLGRIPI